MQKYRVIVFTDIAPTDNGIALHKTYLATLLCPHVFQQLRRIEKSRFQQ